MEKTERIAKTLGIKPSAIKTIIKIVVILQLIGLALFAVFFVAIFSTALSRIIPAFTTNTETNWDRNYFEGNTISYSFSDSVGEAHYSNESANHSSSFGNAESAGVSYSSSNGFSVSETEHASASHTAFHTVNQ